LVAFFRAPWGRISKGFFAVNISERSDVAFANRKLLVQQARLPSPSPSPYKSPRSDSKRTMPTAAELSLADGMRWFRVAEGQLFSAESPSEALFGMCAVRRNFDLSLVLVARGDGLLADGLPVLRFSVLDIRTTLLVPGIEELLFINRSVRPFCGQPPAAILGSECPICKIKFDGDTQVASCACGAFFHNETQQSHPAVCESDRLSCFQLAGKCGRCGSPLTIEEQFAWRPELQ
jgi:hypothetical protein